MLSDTQTRICEQGGGAFEGLKAILFNATLKHPGQASHTDTLLDVVAEIFASQKVEVERVRLT